MDLIKPIVNSGNTENILPAYLSSCKDQASFLVEESNQEKTFLGIINSKLNETSTKFVGLSLLHTYIQQCPQSIVNENVISWMSLCLRGTVIPVPSTCSLSYEVLGSLIRLCSDQAKHVGSAVLPKLFDHLQSVPKQCLPSALNCLQSCMTVYSGPCGPHKNSIQKFLLPLLEFKGANAAAIVCKTATCLALLPKLGGGGTGGVGYQQNWTKQFQSACNTLHQILDALYSSVNDLEIGGAESRREEDVELLQFEPIQHEDAISSAYAQALRFEGIVCYIEAMLMCEIGVVKNVRPNDVLSVVCRGLAVTSVSLRNISTTESLSLLSLLPKLHTKLFQLLNALIYCCGGNLLPFGRMVVRLVLQTLKWTSVKDWKHKTSKPYGSLRTIAYQCLKHWLDTVKTVPTCDELAELVAICCSDFRSETEGVKLLVAKKKNKYSDRNEAKRKRSLNTTQESWAADPDSIRTDAAANKDVCIAALQTVQALLTHYGWALNIGSYTMLQDASVKLLLSITSQSHNPIIPFGQAEPRLELYRLLLSLVSHPHPLVASPIRVAGKLFSAGLNDSNAEVSVFCSHALNVVEKIVNPSFTPLALPLPLAEDEEGRNETDPIFTSLIPTDTVQLTKEVKKPPPKEVKTNDSKNVPKASENEVKGSDTVQDKKRKSTEPAKDDEKAKNSKKSKKDEKTVFPDLDEASDFSEASTLSNGLSSLYRKSADVESRNETVLVSDSGSCGGDIEEVPVEIDIADSDGDSAEPQEATSNVGWTKEILAVGVGKTTASVKNQGSNGVQVIEDSDIDDTVGEIGYEDYRLCLSPDSVSIVNNRRPQRNAERKNEETKPSKRSSDAASSEKMGEEVMSVSRENNKATDECAEVPVSEKALTVSEDTGENELDVETMLASFVDKVKPTISDMEVVE